MPGVVDEPLSRLYAGALLGKALAKETGEVGAQQGWPMVFDFIGRPF